MNLVIPARGPYADSAMHTPSAKKVDGSRLRILHVLDRLAMGGTELVVLKLVNGLNKQTCEHRLVALRGTDPAFKGMEIPGGTLLIDGKQEDGFNFFVLRLARIMRGYLPHIVPF